MFFRLRPYITEGKVQGIRQQCTMCDACCCYTGNGSCFLKMAAGNFC